LVGRMYNSRAQELQSSRAFSYVHKSIAMCAYFWHACRPSALSAALSARARVLMEANRAVHAVKFVGVQMRVRGQLCEQART